MHVLKSQRSDGIGGHESGLIRNISWLGIANIVVKPAWFLFITAASMRFLGVEEYGVMNATLSLCFIASSFTDLGMGRYSLREVARDHTKGAIYFTNFMALRTATSLVAWAGAMAVGLLLEYKGVAFLALVFAGIYVFSMEWTNYCRVIYEAMENLRFEAIMLIIEKVLVIGFGLVLLIWTGAAHWTLAGMALGMVVTSSSNAFLTSRRLTQFDLTLLDAHFLKRTLRAMLPFGLAGLFTGIYFRVDIVMIEYMLGEIPTGQYGAAYRILEALIMLPSIVALSAVFPRLAKLRGTGKLHEFRRLFRQSMIFLTGASIAIAAILSLIAPWLISVLSGDAQFGPSAGALRILAWAFPFFCANTLLFITLVTMDEEVYLAILLGMAVLVNVGLNFVAIPALGIEGAALATIMPEAALVFLYTTRYRKISAAETA